MTRATASPILQLIRQTVEDPRVRNLSDQDLLRRFAAGHDEAAFHALLRRHGPMVLDICRAVLGREADAEDAFQATFLVLARKAGSIHEAASLPSWLHGVAYRSALKARAQSASRQKREARVPHRPASEADDLTWQEVRQIVHEEVSRLAERYRAPLVSCYLEGKTQDEAAAQLGLAKGTLKGRLERARQLLRARLVRRGLGPAGLLAAAAWPAAKASACLPTALVASTAQAATEVVAGDTAAPMVSAKVVALTEGVLRAMYLTKLRTTTALLLGAVVLAAGAGLATLSPRAVEARQPAPADAPPSRAAAAKTADDPKVIQQLKDAGAKLDFYTGKDAGFVRRVGFERSRQEDELKATDDTLALLAKLEKPATVNFMPHQRGQFTDDGLKHLNGLTTLTTVGLQFGSWTDRGLVHLKGLKRLQYLFLTGDFTGEGLKHLDGLPVTQLIFDDQFSKSLDQANLVHLKGLRKLHTLFLNTGEPLGDEGLRHLGALASLRQLSLGATRPGKDDDGLSHLKGLRQLKTLALFRYPITDAGLANFKDLAGLETLDVAYSQVRGPGLVHLKGLTKLKYLRLGGTWVTDDGLANLKELRGCPLERVDLNDTAVSDAGLEHVKGLSGLQSLDLSKTRVTDEGLKHLHGLTRLRRLNLRDTEVREAAIAGLNKALPQLKVER